MSEPRTAIFVLRQKESQNTPSSKPRNSERPWCLIGRSSFESGIKNVFLSLLPIMQAGTQRMVFVAFFLVAFSADLAHAVVYNASKIIAIAVGARGEVYIRWDGLPDPGPCGGENNHWVVIPATASDTMKSLALSLYFSGKAVRIDTAAIQGTPPSAQPAGACTGAYENVTLLYSPSGG